MESLRERFGKYHVLERIAQGGMAEVYKVKTVGIAGFEKVQALKRILPAQAHSSRFIRSFIDEARIAVELNHRNIVQVFDFGKADGELYLAMELIEGIDLRAAMAAGAEAGVATPVPLACYVVAEIGAGLDYAHRKLDDFGRSLGIVHCDVSPANIMLSNDGYVKILDFGISRARFASALELRRLRGRPRYMAPEQTRGDAPTPATDVFALGIIAWELVTGQPLFDGADLGEILSRVRRAEAPRADHVNPAVPSFLADAVAQSLSLEPARRSTAMALSAAAARAAGNTGARALEAWLSALGIVTPSSPRPVSATAETEGGERTAWVEDTAPADRTLENPATSVTASTIMSPGTKPIVPGLRRVRAASLPPVRPRTGSAPRRPGDGDYLVEPSGELPLTLDDDPAWGELDLGLAAGSEPGVVTAPAPDVIDDDLGAPASTVLLERRRAVVVSVAVDGAHQRSVAAALGDLAYKRGGVVLAGDDGGVVVAFGLEIAGEDDLAIAMAYALDAAAVGRDLDPHATVRIGGRAGVVIYVGGGARRVPSDAFDEARQLARDAQPGRPLFAGGVGRSTSAYFSFRELPARRPLHRRGRVLELTGPRSFDERDRALLDRRGQFVGRGAALATLADLAQTARTEDRCVSVLVRGGAGSGKSRLVAEFVARAQATPPAPILISAQATPSARLAPFAMIVDWFQAALNLPPGRGRAARARLATRLGHILGRSGVEADRAAAMADTLAQAMELRDGGAVEGAEATDLHNQVAAAVTAFRIAHRPAGGLLLTVLEDLHLADHASLEVLRLGLTVPERGAELVLVTSRGESPTRPLLEVDAAIDLDDLVGSELRELVVDRLGEAATPMAVAAVIQRAGGNPLFVEELAAAVREAGADVPATARDVIAARVDRLRPAAKTLLQYAAVMGDAVRPRLLEEVVAGDLPAALEELTAEGFLVRTDRAAPDAAEGELAFARGLVREVVYDSLSARARREAHAGIGKLLASRFHAGRDEPPAIIAEHLERGGELAGAAAFWLRAARLARAAFDADAAVAHLSKTLALEAQLGAAPPTPASRARRREALASRDELHRLHGDLVRDAGDLDQLAALAGDAPGRRADVEHRRAQRLIAAGDLTAASAAIDRATEHARVARDEGARAEALRLRSEVLERLGRHGEALDLAGEARALFRRLGATAGEAAAMLAVTRIHLAQGNLDAAHELCSQLEERVLGGGDPWLERMVPGQRARIDLGRSDFAAAMESARRALELCRRHGDRVGEGESLVLCGAVLDEAGRHDQAAAWLSEAAVALARTGARVSRANYLVYHGANQAHRRDAAAEATLTEALALAGEIGARPIEAATRLARAAARLDHGALEAATVDASAAVQLAAGVQLAPIEVTALARWAESLRRTGRPGDAHAVSIRAVAMLERGRCGACEEVLAVHARVLAAVGHTAEAAATWQRARQALRQRLERLDDEWRTALAARPLHRELLQGTTPGDDVTPQPSGSRSIQPPPITRSPS